MKIVLASASPRRSQILENAGFEFTVRVSDAEEKIPKELSPAEVSMFLAKEKAHAVERNSDEMIIAADTIVVLGSDILGKPKDSADAVRTLQSLSGKVHTVYTGVCMLYNEKEENFFDSTEVEFYSLENTDIENYVKTGEPLDKAGSYGIQGKGALFVRKINGDYFNVMGLPIGLINQKIKKF